MSSTAIAISSTALAISAQASSKAKKAACSAAMNGYQHSTATVSQAQEYASCINYMNPSYDGSDVLWAKAFVLIALVCFLVGAYLGWKEDSHPIPVVCFGIFGAAAGFLLALAVYGLVWVFS